MIKIKTNSSVNLMGSAVYATMAWLGYGCALAANDLHHVHLCAQGDKFQEVHEAADKYLGRVRELGDFCLEVAREGEFPVANETMALQVFNDKGPFAWEPETEDSYHFTHAFETMSNILTKLAQLIADIEQSDILTSDIASELDVYLREFTKEVNYFIAQKLQ